MYFKRAPEREWASRTAADRPLAEAMLDPVWRIANIYTFYNKRSRTFEPFRPKPEQAVIIWAIFVLGRKNIIIPKARQIGFSTLLAIICVDITLFNAGAKCALVDKSKVDGAKKFNDIVRIAWDRLPAGLRKAFEDPIINQSEFSVKRLAAEDDGWSRFRVEHSGRGDALVFLWVSEWATIQFEEPLRSNEILTGGMEAAEGNIRVIETTWKGGEDGDVWPFVKAALSKRDEEKTADDWFIYFFPWWVEPNYSREGSAAAVSAATSKYLDNIEREITAESGHEFKFTAGQRLWYEGKKDTLGLFMLREYPSVLRECWLAPIEGAIYAEPFAEALAAGRVVRGIYRPDLPVFTAWDLGGPENMVVWYFQVHGGGIWWIDCDMRLWLTTPQRVARMKEKGHHFAKHFIPHDAAQAQKGAVTYENELLAAGLENVVVVPRTRDEWLGINKVLQLFGAFHFEADKTADACKSVKAFHVHEKTKEPVHDWSSHACDGLRTMAEAAIAGHLNLDTVGMVNYDHLRYFDSEALTYLRNRAVEWQPRMKLGAIEQETWVPKESAAAGGWLRMWEGAYAGERYLLTMAPPKVDREGWAICVWRQVVRSGMKVPLLCAAVSGGIDLDDDRAAQWAAAMSRHYGRCLVVPLIDDHEGLASLLEIQRCGPLWLREEPRENQPVGSGRTNRKPGFKGSEHARAEAIGKLREMSRELLLDCGAAEIGQQMEHHLQIKAGEPPGPSPGHGEAWVMAAALACHGIGQATLFSMRQPVAPPSRGRGHEARTAIAADWRASAG